MMKTFNYLKIIFLLLLPLIIYLVPVNSIEEHPLPCLSRLLFHRECWGCGITRACLNAIHFNFEKSLKYNHLVIIVLPLCIICYIKYLYIIIKNFLHKFMGG